MRRFPIRKTLLITLFLVLGTWGLVELVAWRAESRLEGRFSAIADGLSVEDRYPPTEPNETVQVLGEIGTRLGIRMANLDEGHAGAPDDEAASAWRDTQIKIGDFLLEERRQRADTLPAPDPDLEDFLIREATTLDRLRTVLATEEQPIWYMDLSEGFEARIPNYLGVLSIQRLLIFDALESSRRGDGDLAMESLEASWRLNEVVLGHPYLIAQLVGIAVLNEQIPLFLRLHPMSSLWQERLRELRIQSGMRRGLELEAWVAYHSARRGRFEIGSDPMLERLSGPYLRWALFDHSERLLAIVDDLWSERQSSFDIDRIFEDHMADMPRWNLLGQLIMPNISEAWTKAKRADLALDLVRQVGRLRDAIAAGDLESIPSRQASVLEGLFWEVESSTTAVEIRLDGDLEVVQENPLPLSYRISLER